MPTEWEKGYTMSDDDDTTLGEKREALTTAGWKATTSWQGIFTKYLPPGKETGALTITSAYKYLQDQKTLN
jgi:hypothetical protein